MGRFATGDHGETAGRGKKVWSVFVSRTANAPAEILIGLNSTTTHGDRGMVITFWGAAKTTTGSFHLLENRGRRVVLDCGLFQGHRSEFYARNADFPCQPKDVDALLLSHAHIDHCGNIPNFTKHGFDGPIFCTAATQDLTRELILDSAHIQEKDAIFVNKQRRKHGEEPVEPLYSRDDAEAAFPLFVGMGMNRDFCFVDGFLSLIHI